MAKRLSESILPRMALVLQQEIGQEICRNCGSEIVVDPDDSRPARLPHRWICRRCGAEYGTTRGG